MIRDTVRKRGYSTREAAVYIGRSVSWLRKKRLRGVCDPGDPGPRYLKTAGGGAIYLLEGYASLPSRECPTQGEAEALNAALGVSGLAGDN